MSADRLSLLVERHSLLLFVRHMQRTADEARLDAQHIDADVIGFRARIAEIDRYLDQMEEAQP